MNTVTRSPDESVLRFQQRMDQLKEELRSINKELGRQDLLMIAHRTEELLRHTRGLLEGNVTILFAGKPDRVVDSLYEHIHYAEGHIARARGDEYEFDRIKQRLYMATALTEYVLRQVGEAVTELIQRELGGLA